ncbi:methyltransferase [Immundisolibacter sp.]|uniref:methyltransferase n=1 Tax=Immundisolibacter sp. TaxID=1934948 RepID=UPI003563B120
MNKRIPVTIPDPATRLSSLIASQWMSQAIYAAAQLRIPDLLADSAMSSEELAGATQTHAPSLHRLLRALTTLDICEELGDGVFALTPMGALLRGDSAESLRAWALYSGGSQWPVWGHLIDSIRTGRSARHLITGNKAFEHAERDPEVAAIFNQAMVELTRLVATRVVYAYDFSTLQRIVDVGGGSGQLLAAILRVHPAVRGVLFDLPHAIEAGRRLIAEAGLAQRCEIVAGDFFEAVPGPADAYLLKSVLHDWDDEQSLAILRNCYRAMTAQGRLLLVERVVPLRLGVSAEHQTLARIDLNMLIGPGGRERTEAEFRALLTAAGFCLHRVVEVELSFKLIEATRVQ